MLTEHGLAPALRTLAARSPVPVELREASRRAPAGAVEAAAYFVVSEALANVAKHAHASDAVVSVVVEGRRARGRRRRRRRRRRRSTDGVGPRGAFRPRARARRRAHDPEPRGSRDAPACRDPVRGRRGRSGAAARRRRGLAPRPRGPAQSARGAGFELVGEAETADELLDVVERERPDAVLVDIRASADVHRRGLRAGAEIRERHDDVALLVLSQYVEAEYALRCSTGTSRGSVIS